MNRCKHCNVICPDFSDVCDTCAYIEEEDNEPKELTESKWEELLENNAEGVEFEDEENA